MSKNLLDRYIWIVDTIRRHGAISREQLGELWSESEFGKTTPRLPRRTFYNYRNAIAEIFHIEIQWNPSTYEYYIDDEDNQSGNLTDWMLSSASLSATLTDAREVSDRIFMEDVPSAREHLPVIIAALKGLRRLKFDYHPFSRSAKSKDVVIEPYFLKIFKLRWYVTGRNLKDKKVKTYSLDRMSDVSILNELFKLPAGFNAEAYFHDCFGIVFSQGRARKVTLRVDAEQAKYFRALPLHHSQSEMMADGCSIFTYRLRLTPDLVAELLSYGPRVTVLGPPELRAMITSSLSQSLSNYQS